MEEHPRTQSKTTGIGLPPVVDHDKATLVEHEESNHGKIYLLLALGGFLCLGCTNWLLGIVAELGTSGAAVSGAILVWCGCGIVALCAWPIRALMIRQNKDLVTTDTIDCETSDAISPISSPNHRHRRLHTIAGLVLGLLLSAGMLSLKTGLSLEPQSKGPIVSIISVNSVIVGLLSFIVLKERLSLIQTLGILIAVSGLIIMVLTPESTAASYLAFLFGVISMTIFSIVNFGLKYAAHAGADSLYLSMLLWTSSGVAGVFGLLITFVLDIAFAGLEMNGQFAPVLVICSLAAGISLAFGMFFMKSGVKRGPAGPVTAITTSNAVLVLVLDLIYPGHFPSDQKVAGMFVCLFGVILLALAPVLQRTWRARNTRTNKEDSCGAISHVAP